MIEQQIRTWSVLDDAVLMTMGNIPRDIFVPEPVKSLAYADIEVPLDHDQSMMFPRIEGRMLQELEININDSCLEVGTGSGYVTACLANMSKHVDSIDIYDDFLESASNNLASVNISNIELQNKDALTGLHPRKKYDVIAVTGSVPEYLPLFEKLLNPEGRLFIVVGSDQIAHAMKIVRTGNSFVRTSLFETELMPLIGAKKEPRFTF